MERDRMHRDPAAPRVKKPSKKAPPHAVVSGIEEILPEGSVSCEVVPPGVGGSETAAIGAGQSGSTQEIAASLGKGTAAYRVVIQCGLDRRKSGSSR